MYRKDRDALKALLDICWNIHRANLEGGDIAAGQYLDQGFEQILKEATQVFGRIYLDSPQEKQDEKNN